jgi:hypothetical protein
LKQPGIVRLVKGRVAALSSPPSYECMGDQMIDGRRVEKDFQVIRAWRVEQVGGRRRSSG